MFANSAKGFHIHPPSIPADTTAEKWLRRLFINKPQNYSLRPYDREQWDIMFFIQGICEMFLIDERVGMPRRKMRFIIEGDDLRGENNVGVVIPAGVAHAIVGDANKPGDFMSCLRDAWMVALSVLLAGNYAATPGGWLGGANHKFGVPKGFERVRNRRYAQRRN